MAKEFLKIPNGRDRHNVPIQEIIYVYTKAGRSEFHLPGGLKYKWNKNLCKVLEELREHDNFIQTDRSFIANVKKVKTYRSKGGGGIFVMINGGIVDISRRNKPESLKKYRSL